MFFRGEMSTDMKKCPWTSVPAIEGPDGALHGTMYSYHFYVWFTNSI
jgi:hypothetical protein